MEVSRGGLEISQKDIEDILLLCDIAKSNGSALTLEDAVALTAINATEEQLERLLAENKLLGSNYVLSSDFIVERYGDADRERTRQRRYIEDMNRARENLAAARRFAPLVRSGSVRLISVSGSTSYQFARKIDDIDFFCVTARDEMWTFMLKTLLIARLYRWRNRRGPPVCFSCVMDERRAAYEFVRAKDPLFARDALTAKVMHGTSFFRQLLGMSRWMRRYYPRLYDSKMGDGTAPRVSEGQRRPVKRAVNLYLYLVVGGYVRLKSRLLNRRFRSEGRRLSLFKVKLAEDQCVYESARYEELRAAYSGLKRS